MNVLRITVLLLMVCLFANGCSGDKMKKSTNVGNAASGSIVSESISGTTAVNYSPCFDIDKDYDYEISDNAIIVKEGNIDFKIHFPEIKSKGFESLNRFIKRTVDEKTEWVEWKKNHQKGEEKEVLHIDVDYNIIKATDLFISIRFKGLHNLDKTAHPINIDFCINYDLKENREIRLNDIIINNSVFEKKRRECFEKYAKEESSEFGYLDGLKRMWSKHKKECLFNTFYFYVEESTLYLGVPFSAGSMGVEYIPINFFEV